MAIIKLHGMQFHSLHGVLPCEGIIGNDYEINVEMDVNCMMAEENDDLSGTINYADVYNIVKQEMSQPSKLIEHVAARIRKSIMSTYGDQIKKLSVEVRKKRPPVGGVVDYASVTVTN